MGSPEVEASFRPFEAVDDGARLVLRRRRGASDWLLRVMMYWLLALVLVLAALIPYAAWTRGRGPGDALLAIVLLLPTWFVLRLVLLGFAVEGVRRLVVERGRVALDSRGALLRRRVTVDGIEAVEATTTTRQTRYGAVRWLRLRARTGAGHVELGALTLDAEAEPASEAAARAGAMRIAARIGAPLELDAEAAGS